MDHQLLLWPGGAIPNYQDSGETLQTEITDCIRLSLVQEPDIAVYLPPKRCATGEAFLICPGGSYGVLSYDWEGVQIAKWLNSKGIAGIIVKYRLPNSKSNIVGHLSPLLDVKRAMRLTRHHASQWNVQRNKIGIIGFSAGGHLAATLSTRFDEGDKLSADPIEKESCRPDFSALIYPVITMTPPHVHENSRNNLIGADAENEIISRYSNELHAQENTPPTFIVHSADDDIVKVENSILIYQALKDKNVPVEMHLYPFGGHGFSLAISKEYLQGWTDRFMEWFCLVNK
jgi:acetyl esterase/lipase